MTDQDLDPKQPLPTTPGLTPPPSLDGVPAQGGLTPPPAEGGPIPTSITPPPSAEVTAPEAPAPDGERVEDPLGDAGVGEPPVPLAGEESSELPTTPGLTPPPGGAAPTDGPMPPADGGGNIVAPLADGSLEGQAASEEKQVEPQFPNAIPPQGTDTSEGWVPGSGPASTLGQPSGVGSLATPAATGGPVSGLYPAAPQEESLTPAGNQGEAPAQAANPSAVVPGAQDVYSATGPAEQSFATGGETPVDASAAAPASGTNLSNVAPEFPEDKEDDDQGSSAAAPGGQTTSWQPQ